jgi:hypothetical protein
VHLRVPTAKSDVCDIRKLGAKVLTHDVRDCRREIDEVLSCGRVSIREIGGLLAHRQGRRVSRSYQSAELTIAS